MKVIYSIGAKFAGGGIGTTAYHAVSGLHRHRMLIQLLCGSYRPTEIPTNKIRAFGLPNRAMRKLATYDSTGWLWYWQSVLYDTWSASHLEDGDWFHVWGNYGLKSLVKAKRMGMVTSIERASSHPLYQAKLLKEEYARWGLTFRIPEANLRRSLAELEMADYVFIPSDFVRKSFLEEGFPVEKLIQISFGVDTNRFCRLESRPSHPFRVLFVGQASIRKGILYLLEAWKQLNWTDAELWIVGQKEPIATSLLDKYQSLPGLKFIGYVADPVSVYQQSDVFVFPSIEEGSALVSYEAMACGLPSIVTPNVGSVIRNNVDGLLCSPGSVDQMVESLEKLRRNSDLRLAMSKNSREQAIKYSWKSAEDNLVEKYEQFVKPK